MIKNTQATQPSPYSYARSSLNCWQKEQVPKSITIPAVRDINSSDNGKILTSVFWGFPHIWVSLHLQELPKPGQPTTPLPWQQGRDTKAATSLSTGSARDHSHRQFSHFPRWNLKLVGFKAIVFLTYHWRRHLVSH